MPRRATKIRQVALSIRNRLSRLGRIHGGDEIAHAVDQAMAVEGQITRAEAGRLLELARGVARDDVIVEIGTYRGRSAIALALGSSLGHRSRVFAVDPHVEFVGQLGGRFGPEDQRALYENLARTGVGNLVAVISLPSQKAALAWSGASIGLLWIDGDHRYQEVKADFESWYPHVVPGGIIAFHDAPAEDVARFLQEVGKQRLMEPIGSLDRMRWFRKVEPT